MKKIILFVVSAFFFTSSFYIAKIFKTPNSTFLKIAYRADSVDQLIDDSQMVAVAHVTNIQKSLKYENVEFVKTQIEVKNLLKGSNNAEKIITILQTVSNDDPVLEKNSNVLLFLEKYEGPIIENAYVIKGLYQGHYKIHKNNIIATKNGNGKLKDSIESKTIEQIEQKIH